MNRYKFGWAVASALAVSAACAWLSVAPVARSCESSGPAAADEKKTREALKKPVTIEFVETPLGDVVDFLRDLTGLNFVLDPRAAEAGVTADSPITVHLEQVSLASAIKLMLLELDATFVINDDVLVLTSQANAKKSPAAKVAVSDPAVLKAAEEKIRQKLSTPATLEFVETPLSDIVDFLRDLTGLNFVMDARNLGKASIGRETAVTIKTDQTPVEDALRRMLDGIKAGYVIRDEVVLITTRAEAEKAKKASRRPANK